MLKGMEYVCMPQRSQVKDSQPATAWDGWASDTEKEVPAGACRRWPLQTQDRVSGDHPGETTAGKSFERDWLSAQQEKGPT